SPSPRLRGEGWGEGSFREPRSWRGPLTRIASCDAIRHRPASGRGKDTTPRQLQMTQTLEIAHPASATAPLLAVRNIEVVYDDVILVLRGLSLEVPKGAIVALLGANGAGKSTTLKAISGLLKTEDGEVTRGEIIFDGA